jgi:hypothetical protein
MSFSDTYPTGATGSSSDSSWNNWSFDPPSLNTVVASSSPPPSSYNNAAHAADDDNKSLWSYSGNNTSAWSNTPAQPTLRPPMEVRLAAIFDKFLNQISNSNYKNCWYYNFTKHCPVSVQPVRVSTKPVGHAQLSATATTAAATTADVHLVPEQRQPTLNCPCISFCRCYNFPHSCKPIVRFIVYHWLK